jgi:arylsulfatase A-like enzyme
MTMPTDRPNILLFFTDQHRLSALGCYGDTPCRTPNIDRLAAEGVRFETAYTCCPVCTPARASVMTGKHIHAHGMISNTHNLGNCISQIPDGPHLLSRRLGEAGYRCGYTGKWHLGTAATEWFGEPQHNALPSLRGFEGQDFQGHGGGGFGYPEYQAYLREHGWRHEVERGTDVWGCGTLAGPVESTVPYFLADNTIGMVDRFADADEPFFIWHNNWGPHAPYFAPERFVDMYRDVEIPPWPNFEWPAGEINRPHQVKRHPRADELTWEDWAEAVRYYYAFTTLIDEQIGRILDHLERTGLAENTVVIFTSDHGETLGSHGGLTDKGWHHFEEIQRIGMILRGPSAWGETGCAPGTVLPQWASLLDVYPTICDLAGSDYDADAVHGRSLLPLLRGATEDWRDELFVEFCGVNNLATSMITCRSGDLKYGWNCSNRDELYDLADDPHETRNLVDDPACSDAVGEMRERIDAFMQRTGHPGRRIYQRSRMGVL